MLSHIFLCRTLDDYHFLTGPDVPFLLVLLRSLVCHGDSIVSSSRSRQTIFLAQSFPPFSLKVGLGAVCRGIERSPRVGARPAPVSTTEVRSETSPLYRDRTRHPRDVAEGSLGGRAPSSGVEPKAVARSATNTTPARVGTKRQSFATDRRGVVGPPPNL